MRDGGGGDETVSGVAMQTVEFGCGDPNFSG
jgi:hypothetical protein